MKNYTLYFRVEINSNKPTIWENYLDFRRDLFDCCKITPYFEEIGKGMWNIYLPSLDSGLVFKGKLKEMEEKYQEYLI